ncbi:MAG: TOBE domain-containing protein, partial [Desulfobacteraceae bacterium]|nr:TOBE domain-containing protein [Desulfobacteraceae bacterium]
VHVTHDLREAEEIADRIALISHGTIEQISTPAALFFNPVNESVSEFIGMPNIIECEQSRILDSGLVEVASDGLRMVLPCEEEHIKKVAIPPDGVYLSNTKPPGPALNRFTGTVEEIKRHNSMVRVRVSIGHTSLLSELPVSTFEEMAVEKGKQVHVIVKMGRLRYVAS